MSSVTGRLENALAGRYRLEGQFDSGGMAVVYGARDLKHDRKVAIKVFRPELSAVLGVERFNSEIKISANLQHPHVLPLFDSGSADGLLFYVMPFVEGISLRTRLERERQLSVEEAVRITAQVGSALDYAHRHGVIHRDIKPENILLQDGEVLVADFGIALAVEQSGGNRLTETGLSLGTPQYMSPEQATGERHVDSRTDIYSLGVVLYEMLAGEAPHTGPTMQAVIAKILTENPKPITQIRRSTPPHVDAVIACALARIPADRYATAQQMVDALLHPDATVIRPAAAWAGDGGSTALVPRLRRITRLAAVPVVALLAGILIGRGRTPSTPGDVAKFTIPTTSPQLDQNLGQLPLLTITPDGRALVFTQDGKLHIRRLDRFESVPLEGTGGATTPAFSSDGRWLVFGQNGRLRKVSAEGGPVVDIATANYRLGAFWADDGYIYYSAGLGDRGIWRVSADGGQPEQVTQLRDDATEHAHGWPQLLPGGKELLFTALGNSGGAEDSRIMVERLSDHRRTTLIEHAVYGHYVASGHVMYSTGNGAVFAVPYSVSRGAITGRAIPVLDGTTVAVWGGATLFNVSNEGTLVYVPGSATQQHVMQVVDRGGRELRQLGVPRNIRGAVYSPDGRRVATTVREPGRTDVWLLNSANGGAEWRFTLDLAEEEMPVWSADGKTIAYTAAAGPRIRVVRKAVAEGTEPQDVRSWARHMHLTSWSRDGKWLAAYDYHPTNNEDVWLIGAAGKDSLPVATTASRELNGVFSPDGRWLAYQSDEPGRFEVYVVNIPAMTVKRQVSTGGGIVPRWDPSGRSLYFLSPADHKLMSVAVNADNGFELRGTPTALFSTPAFDFDIAPDGSGFLLSILNPNVSTPAIHVVINWFDELRKLTAASTAR
jgi:serine/threonine-protein kinase